MVLEQIQSSGSTYFSYPDLKALYLIQLGDCPSIPRPDCNVSKLSELTNTILEACTHNSHFKTSLRVKKALGRLLVIAIAIRKERSEAVRILLEQGATCHEEALFEEFDDFQHEHRHPCSISLTAKF
jgi:hypothetical protein